METLPLLSFDFDLRRIEIHRAQPTCNKGWTSPVPSTPNDVDLEAAEEHLYDNDLDGWLATSTGGENELAG